MRGLLLVLLLLVVGGCDDASGDRAAGLPSEFEWEVVATVSATAGGGAVARVAVPLDGPVAVDAFTVTLSADLASRVREEVAAVEPRPDRALYGAVVAVGCDAPDDVTVSRQGSDVLVAPVLPSTSPRECLAPMTTVALVRVRAT